MSKVIMGNGDFTVPQLVLKVFQHVESNSTNPCIHNFSFLLAQNREPQSSTAKLLIQGVKLTVFSGSNLAPKYFKVVANSKKLVAIMTTQFFFFTLSLY